MQLLLAAILFLSSLFVAAPELDLGKFHELAQGESFQKDISVFRKEVRQRTQKNVQSKNSHTGVDESVPLRPWRGKQTVSFQGAISPHLFQYLNPHTLPLPPPVVS